MPKYPMHPLVEALRAALFARGLTSNYAIAEAAGLPRMTVGRVFAGTRADAPDGKRRPTLPSLDVLDRLAGAAGGKISFTV